MVDFELSEPAQVQPYETSETMKENESIRPKSNHHLYNLPLDSEARCTMLTDLAEEKTDCLALTCWCCSLKSSLYLIIVELDKCIILFYRVQHRDTCHEYM